MTTLRCSKSSIRCFASVAPNLMHYFDSLERAGQPLSQHYFLISPVRSNPLPSRWNRDRPRPRPWAGLEASNHGLPDLLRDNLHTVRIKEKDQQNTSLKPEVYAASGP